MILIDLTPPLIDMIDFQVGVASIPMVAAGQMLSKSKRGIKTMHSGGVEFVAPIRMNGIDVGMINGTFILTAGATKINAGATKTARKNKNSTKNKSSGMRMHVGKPQTAMETENDRLSMVAEEEDEVRFCLGLFGWWCIALWMHTQ